MPVEPNNGQLFVDLSTEAGVAELVRVAGSLDPSRVGEFRSPDARIAADIADHLLFLSATNPQWFAPYRDLAMTSLAHALPMDVGAAAVLLPGASPYAVDRVLERLATRPDDWSALTLLAGADDPQGMAELADVIRAGGDRTWTNSLGVHVGATGPAVRRFTPHRYAIVAPSAGTDGEVGLDLAAVADDPDQVITWHYASLRAGLVAGLPPWPHEQVHIVSPRTIWFTLQCQVDDSGRYTHPVVDDGGEPFDHGLREAEADPPDPTGLSLRAYDADLTYRNGHVHLTPGVVGDAGGPPIGLYPNPECPQCGVLMFHVASVRDDIREYGDGFRSVFLCETCVRAAVTGTNFN